VAALGEAGLASGDRVVVEPVGDGELRVRRAAVTFESAFGALTGAYPPGYLERLAAEAIAALGVALHPPTEATSVDAARLRGKFPISLPDAYALATARQVGGTLVSFDRRVSRAAAEAGISGLRPSDA
jgi:predicted nucleic acid-binding protein